ncbi:MAG: exopolysaccharide biosynthesis protein [Phycisphaerae bacterium]|nr:exopolysaccharide biosynthesis protein [Phycisphaerae bacterium]
MASQLRLSSILTSLCQQAHPLADPPGAPQLNADPPPPAGQPKTRSNLTLGDIIDRTAHAGFGFLTAFLALVAIPFTGLSLPFGLAIAFLGIQMVAGKDRPWLPRRLRRRVVAMSTIDWIGRKVTRWTHGLERLIRPRLVWFARGPFWTLVGIGLILQGIGLAFPIPIPASNWAFIVPILIYGIGLLEDDGALILAGHIITAGMIALGAVFWELVHQRIAEGLTWVARLW